MLNYNGFHEALHGESFRTFGIVSKNYGDHSLIYVTPRMIFGRIYRLEFYKALA